MQAPASLVVLNGGMAMDGGSIFLRCVSSGRDINVSLDWSIASRRRGEPQLAVDERPIPRGSAEEAIWLQLIERAEFRIGDAPPAGDRISPRAIVLSDDIGDYFAAIHRGPAEALQHLARQLVALVRSVAYQSPEREPSEPPPSDPLLDVRDLVTAGKRVEAIRWYRDRYPNATLSEAMKVVDEIARGKGP